MRYVNFIVIIVVIILQGCTSKSSPITISAADFHGSVDKLTEIMIHDIFSPPVASRLYVYPNIAAYEVLNQNDASYKSLSGQLKDFSITHRCRTSSE